MPWLISLVANALRYSLTWLGSSIFKAFSSIWAWVLFYLPAIAIHLLKALGVGFIAFSLGDFSIDYIYETVSTELAGLPTLAMDFLRLSGFLDAITIIFGALSARVTYALSVNGSKKMAFLA